MHPRRTRRELLTDAFGGFGALALASVLAEAQGTDAPRSGDPLAPKKPHAPAKAKAVIFLFMAGGPSHVDTFDPKPLLNKLHGQPLPAEFGEAKYQQIAPDAKLLGSARTFKKHGRSGTEVSDLFPHTAKLIDGPLEGKTVATAFLETGDPRPRLELNADAGKRYIYARGAGLEFGAENDDRPTAVEYRFIETVFD